jgi:hypothetical protein
MSKHETPLTRMFWEEVGGTLIEEFLAVKRTATNAQRLIDGLIVLNGPKKIVRSDEISITGEDVIVIQTKSSRLGMYLMGQALFSRELIKTFNPKSIKTVAICTEDDSVLRPLCASYQIEVVIFQQR